MRRIALVLLGLCLTIGNVGCKEDETTEEKSKTETTTTEKTTEDPADPAP